ncbi:MAG: formaldehyde-activating enzyme [Candidatus Nezhaarchaeota archaeon]|nr:formaldehyde-activating enzyme [Candidatus Nezhaarchaeota archaeon]MCX8141195.1 formaldehyde-activating enzyme [Candidatus Nezhaarchaeota archaeon]MDW8049461.1 formaldehyde-activating enzyme [Nitrososphaerota archaeon]
MGKIGIRFGEALVGEGNEVAHIDMIIGDKDGPAGIGFSFGLAHQSAGHIKLFAVLTPNLLVKPVTLMVPKVTIKNMSQAELMFGPAQYAVAKAVADSVAEGVIPKDVVDDVVIICGIFIHPAARDKDKVYKYNYEATKLAIKRAMSMEPKISEILEKKDKIEHPFYKPKP